MALETQAFQLDRGHLGTSATSYAGFRFYNFHGFDCQHDLWKQTRCYHSLALRVPGHWTNSFRVSDDLFVRDAVYFSISISKFTF